MPLIVCASTYSRYFCISSRRGDLAWVGGGGGGEDGAQVFCHPIDRSLLVAS